MVNILVVCTAAVVEVAIICLSLLREKTTYLCYRGVMDELQIEIGCTVSNSNRKPSTTATATTTATTTTHTITSAPTKRSIPPPGKHQRIHNNSCGMIPVSMSAPIVPTTMGSLSSSVSSLSYKSTFFPLPPSLMGPPQRLQSRFHPTFSLFRPVILILIVALTMIIKKKKLFVR